MYKIIGSDGKEYGPASLDQIKLWVQEGRVNSQTRLQLMGESGWKPAGEFAELAGLFPPRVVSAAGGGAVPPYGVSSGGNQPQSGLAITSFVLGLLSMLCLGFLAGIPAIICGHMAHKRARQSPEQFGGAGFAIAGFVMGYASVIVTLLLIAILVPGLTTARNTSEDFRCVNNLKQIGLSFRVWAVDNSDQFPFNVSTNSGGTLELKNPGADGFEKDPALHFQVLSNELSTPVILWCPGDKSKSAAADFESLGNENVSYQLRVGEEINDSNPGEVLAVCPIHNNTVRCDGSVQRGSESPANKPRRLGKSRKSAPEQQ